MTVLLASPVLIAYHLRPEEMQQVFSGILQYVTSRVLG
jgi:hypothetical protein